MASLYLTPASISYLTQFILALAIFVFLARRVGDRNTQLVLLTSFFAAATIFMGLLFLDAALSPFPRLLAVYAENSVLALALVFLLQFAYRFPRSCARRRWEAYASLIASLAYLLWEVSFMIYRYVSLLQWETVYYRHAALAYANALILLWVPIAFLRQTIAADPRPVNGLIKLVKPQGKEARGARDFVFIFAIPFVLGVINVFREYSVATTAFYNISLSIGILVALWLFASSYINFVPGGVSVLTRLSVLTLTLFLAMLGSVGWLISPPYIDTYQPDLTDHQTLQFTPNASGGYDVTAVDFAFETVLGDRLPVQHTNEARNYKIDFAFPFYGQAYTEIYAASSGVVTMGEAFWQPNMQARRANFPAIFPLMIELDPNAGGGLYARQEPERLILTWDHLPALYRPEAVFTFQVVLYRDGVFDITYNGLPLPFRFDPDETPSANPWLRGVIPGRGESLHTSLDDFSGPGQNGQLAIVQNYQLEFRRYLHQFILPLSWVIIGGSLLLLLGLPALVNLSLIKPLGALLAGVRQMEAGDLDVRVAIQNQDEIGFLTHAFNRMASRLGDLVTGLEERVSERTAELAAQNEELDAFAHTVAHDLKEPVSVVVGFAEFLLQNLETMSPQDVAEGLRYVLKTSRQLDRIIEELMLLTGVRTQEVVPEPLDMGHIVEESIERLRVLIEEQHAQITLIDKEAWPVALGYAPWIAEVWANYISNAIKYGGRPPRVELGAEQATDLPASHPAMIRFWVRDNGPGLSTEAQIDLFAPFSRLEQIRAKGHGLGLSVVRRIVEKLSGEVGVESELGRGSTFFFTLPVAPGGRQTYGNTATNGPVPNQRIYYSQE
ncbi:MAG: HAMP domain-containing sensor histidine kinase [Anaerolineae bacterium]|jgi:signal transduction histidine kinase